MVLALLRRAPWAPLVFLLALSANGCAGLSGSANGEAQETRAEYRAVPKPPPPPLPRISVRVVDGDSSKPIPSARVAAASQVARTSARGVASFQLSERSRLRVDVSAPGYESVHTRADVRRSVARVRIWRRATQWTMYGANPGRTQAHSAIRLRPPFRRIWERPLHGLVEFPSVVWEGVAYANNFPGWLRAISMRSGAVLWKRRIGTLVAASPAVDPDRGLLLVTTMEPGYVKALDLQTGRLRWRYYTGRAEPSPVIRDGIAYLAATNGNVYALDLDRHRPRWVFHGGVKVTSSPALVGKRLYYGDYAGRVFALDSRSGRVIWQASAGSRVYGTLAVAGGRVFAPSVFSGVSAFSARSGRSLWRIPIGAYTYSSPAVYRGRVYFGTYEGLVYSVDARSGRVYWRRPAGGAVSGATQVVNGVVYAGSFGSRITAWNWRSGRVLWSFPHGRYVPVSGNGSVLLMHGGGKIWGVVPKRKR